MPIDNHLEAKILKLLAHCQANDWAGYDPYDAVNAPVFAALQKPSMQELWLRHADASRSTFLYATERGRQQDSRQRNEEA